MNVSEIVYRVKAAIGEVVNLDNPRLAEGVNSDNLEHIIVDKISYAFEWVIQNAPISLLEGSLTTQLDSRLAVRKDDGSIEVVLPDDVLRIVSARLSSWFVSPPISDEHSEVAAMQMYPCSKGTYDSPACALYSEDGEQILRMYSACGKDDKIYVSVIRKPTTTSVDPADGTKSLDVPSRLEASFIYYISALTMQAMGENAQSFFEIATLNLKNNGE